MMKLGCAGCGAPLEIPPDLDAFACSYCGVNQRVERKGGIVALRKVEAAIQAVQRGTDRTAAELALARLDKEIAQATAKKQEEVDAIRARIRSARASRWLGAFAAWALTSVIMMSIVAGTSPEAGSGGFLSSLILWLPLAAAVFAFRKTKIPEAELEKSTAEWDTRIANLRSQVASNRALLDR